MVMPINPDHKVDANAVLAHFQASAAEMNANPERPSYDCGVFLLTGAHDCHKMPENIQCETDELNRCLGDCQCYCSRKGFCNKGN